MHALPGLASLYSTPSCCSKIGAGLLNLPTHGVIAGTGAQIDRKHKGRNFLESSSKLVPCSLTSVNVTNCFFESLMTLEGRTVIK